MSEAISTSRGISFDKLEGLFIVIALFVLTGGSNEIVSQLGGTSGENAHGASNTLSLLSKLGIYGVALVLAMRDQNKFFRILGGTWWMLALACAPLISLLWSVDPSTTMRRAFAVVLTVLFCYYLVARVSPEEFLRKLLYGLFVGAILSIIAGFTLKSIAIHTDWENLGAWKGIYGNKAELGRISAFACILVLFVQTRNQREELMRWATLVMFLFLLVMSASRTNWLCTMAAYSGYALFLVLRPSIFSAGTRALASLLIVITVLTVAWAGYTFVLEAFGRDSTLSGRAGLWATVLFITSQKFPLLGSGYGTFFTPAGGLIELIALKPHWEKIPNHAHNGYINTWIEMGVVGIGALAMLMLVNVVLLVKRIYSERRVCWMAFGCSMIIFSINNYSASVAFEHSDIAWAIVLISCLYLQIVAPENVRRPHAQALVLPGYIPGRSTAGIELNLAGGRPAG